MSRWVPVAGLDDQTMVAAASQRALVRTTSGRIGALVRWPSSHNHRSHGRYARVSTRAGTRFSIPCAEVEAVEVPDDEDAWWQAIR